MMLNKYTASGQMLNFCVWGPHFQCNMHAEMCAKNECAVCGLILRKTFLESSQKHAYIILTPLNASFI